MNYDIGCASNLFCVAMYLSLVLFGWSVSSIVFNILLHWKSQHGLRLGDSKYIHDAAIETERGLLLFLFKHARHDIFGWLHYHTG
jgi:hypothetical protein